MGLSVMSQGLGTRECGDRMDPTGREEGGGLLTLSPVVLPSVHDAVLSAMLIRLAGVVPPQVSLILGIVG